MKDGYIKLHRKLFESKMWLDEPFTIGQAWVDLIAMANYADKDNFYRGAAQHIKRGQIMTSKEYLANRWKWSEGRVRRYLRSLEVLKMVQIDSTRRGTLITIENYGVYQDVRRTGKRTEDEQTADRRRTDGGQTATKEESKERKESKRYIPSRADVSAYVSEEGLRADPDAIFDYYESVGWEINGKPIKDWRAVCRRWKQYEAPKLAQSQEENDAELHRLLDILEQGGNIYDTSGS